MSETVAVPAYADVPEGPGIPPVDRPPGYSGADPDTTSSAPGFINSAQGTAPGYIDNSTPQAPGSLMTSDAPGASLAFGAPAWGVFDMTGSIVIPAESVRELEYRGERNLCNFPVEQGGFATYNKVALPFEARVVLTCGTSASARAFFQSSLDVALASLDLFVVVSRDYAYPNVNIKHVTYRRTSESGVSLLSAELWLQEIRIIAASSFTNTQKPDGADPVHDGTVQAAPLPTPSTQAGSPGTTTESVPAPSDFA